MNDVVDLPTMTKGALNVLDNNENGFHLMIEGGAIDWAGHANSTNRDLEEVADFNASVDAVIEWVETNSSWEETLVIVTADHETGYIGGATPGEFNSMEIMSAQPLAAATAPEIGNSPLLSWNSSNHTRQLVGMWVKGAGSQDILALADATDPVRGSYLDNTAVARYLLDTAWVAAAEEPAPGTDAPVESPAAPETPAAPAPGTDAPAASTGAPAASADAAAATTAAEAGDSADNLAATGAEDIAPIAIGAVIIAGAGASLIALRRRAA